MSDNTLLYPSIQPSQTVPNDKWDDEEYWKSNVRWVCSMYNQLVVPPTIQGNPNVDPFYGLQNRFVPQYIKYARYIFGWQYGTNYELTAKDALNNNTQIPLFRGKDVISLFNFYTGKIRDLIKPVPDIMQANCIAGDALSRKTLSLNVMKSLVGARNFLLQEQALGNIKIEAGSDFDITDEQSTEINFEDFIEGSERTYLKFAKNFYISNEAATKIIKGSQYCFIGGRISAHVQERNGKIYMDIIPPEYAIIDMSKNDDQHLDDDYAGQILPYSVSEITSIWKLTEEEANDLDQIAKNGTSQAPYVSGWINFSWYQNYNGVPKVWVAKGVQWQSVVYINDEPVSCIREADLIGNKYLKNQRIVPNSILDKRDKRRKKLNYITCSPNTILGTNLGIVGMIHEMQDIRDSLVTNMLSSINRSMGKSVYIDSSQLPEGMRTPEFLQQLKQNGVIAANRAELEDAQKSNPLIEIIDLTIDPNIITVLSIIQYWDNAIADVLNMPKNVKNGSANYQSEGQIQTNISTSDTGNQWIYASIVKWVQNILELGADLQVKEAINGGENIAVMVGDTMAEMLQSEEVQKCLDSDYKLYLNFDNTLDVNAKITLSQMAVQSAGVNPDAQLDYLKVISSKNIKELMNYYQKERMERLKREQEQAIQQQEQAMAQTQTMVQGQQNMTEQQTQAKLESDAMKIEGKQDEIILKAQLENNKEK